MLTYLFKTANMKPLTSEFIKIVPTSHFVRNSVFTEHFRMRVSCFAIKQIFRGSLHKHRRSFMGQVSETIFSGTDEERARSELASYAGLSRRV